MLDGGRARVSISGHGDSFYQWDLDAAELSMASRVSGRSDSFLEGGWAGSLDPAHVIRLSLPLRLALFAAAFIAHNALILTGAVSEPVGKFDRAGAPRSEHLF